MRYLLNLFSITSIRYPKPLDANFRIEGPFIGVTEPAKRIRLPADRQNTVHRQFVGRGEDFPKATYLPQHVEALSG
jgi:hypothetical protein